MTQTEQVLEMLRSGPVTPVDALDIGCFRLAARIKDLRDDGYEIHSDLCKTESGSRYAQYTLAKSNAA